MRKNPITKAGHALLGALAIAGAVLVPPAAGAKQPPPGSDWLWLSTNSVVNCTWTITVTWSGFREAKTLQAFVTETYNGSPIAPTFVPVRGKTGTATVTVGPLASSATAAYFYPWAQLLDNKGVPIPSSLDFTGQTLEYCTAP